VIVSCSCYAPTPSMAACLVNRFRMRRDVLTYHLAGMGCSSSLVCVDLAKRLLQARPPARGAPGCSAPGCTRMHCRLRACRHAGYACRLPRPRDAAGRRRAWLLAALRTAVRAAAQPMLPGRQPGARAPGTHPAAAAQAEQECAEPALSQP